MQPDTKPSWGITSTAGVISAVVGAIVLFVSVFVEMDNDQIVAVTGALTTLGSVGLVLWGRYAQAKQLSKPPVVVASPVAAGGSELAATARNLAPIQGPGSDRADLDKVEAELDRIQRDAP